MLFFQYNALINAFSSTVCGIWAYTKNPHDRKNRLYAFYCLTLAWWSFFYFAWQLSDGADRALFLTRTLMMGAILIPIAHIHLLSALFDWKAPMLLVIGYIASAIFLISNFTPLFISGVTPQLFFKYWPVPGSMFHLYLVFFAVYVTLSLFTIYRAMKKATGYQKNVLAFVFLATLIGYAGGATNFPLWYGVPIPPVGNCLVTVYTLTVFYIMSRYRFIDIGIIIRKTLIYAVVTGILAAMIVFVAMVSTRFIGSQTLLSSALAACLITVIFHPLTLKVQRFVDRYLFRDWSDRGEMVREIASGFSHELKSPLAGLSMQAQLAMAELEDIESGKIPLRSALPKIKANYRYILTQAMDAARRIEAVRGVAEPVGGPMVAVNASDLLERSLDELKSVVHNSTVTVRRELPTGLPAIQGDPKQLEIVFINLIKNAFQAMDATINESGHTLTLSGQENNGSVLLSIKDTGAGIAMRDLGRIFEPYYTTKGHKGTGMGLYLAQQIVTAHGGSIEVRSAPGQGTEFVVRLPASPAKTRGVAAA
jgi:signal transduction histidine kinase